MGLSNVSSFLYRSTEIEDMETLKKILGQRRGTSGGQYHVAIDLSIFAYKLGYFHCEAKVKKMTQIIEAFLGADFLVTVVADPPHSKRFHTKLASFQRKGVKLQSQCEEFLKSGKKIGLIGSLEEKESPFNIGVRKWCETQENVFFVMDKQAQADAILAAGHLQGDFDVIMSNDNDFHFYCGQRALCIFDQRFDGKKLEWMRLATPSTVMCESCFDFGKYSGSYAIHPIFDNDLRLLPRAAIAVALGSDAWPGRGLLGIGVAKIDDMLKAMSKENELHELTEQEQTELVLSKLEEIHYESCPNSRLPRKMFKDIIRNFASALAYEKTEKYGYIESPPEFLDATLKVFKACGTELTESLESVECVGSCCNPVHQIITVIDHCQCVDCKRTVCEYCWVFFPQPDNDKKYTVCFKCFMEKVKTLNNPVSVNAHGSIPLD